MKRKKYAVFTMDVECFADTECFRSSGIRVDTDLMDGFDEYMRLMDRHGIKNTLFTVGDLAPKMVDRLLQCVAHGHDLALHNHTHVPPMNEPVEDFREQIRKAKARMAELFGVEIRGFRAPCFSMDRERLEVLQELGFGYDSSYLNYERARHTVDMDMQDYRQLRRSVFHKDGFYEFGLSTGRVMGLPFPVSGGGYVRLTPWWFSKPLIRRYVRENDYYVFYLHPFEMTRRKIPFVRGLKAYDQYYIRRGIRMYRKRVEWIIRKLQKQEFEFVTFAQLTQILNREHAPDAAGTGA